MCVPPCNRREAQNRKSKVATLAVGSSVEREPPFTRQWLTVIYGKLLVKGSCKMCRCVLALLLRDSIVEVPGEELRTLSAIYSRLCTAAKAKQVTFSL